VVLRDWNSDGAVCFNQGTKSGPKQIRKACRV